ncbi:NTP transferase domain-containing protein [Subtercola sp. RTI3]|uniref:NTP transferase domain-containing protein n=1 Tax=Subtercola sp. RTI3 TaxID=3048639 RepID=UPI003A5988A2
MNFDAIVLAGGRSSRLGGVPKSGLMLGGQTLLQRTFEAVPDARRCVVVGDVELPLSPRLLVTREHPAFGGPAAAIAAGLDALDAVERVDALGSARVLAGADAAFVLVLACDMPAIAEAVDVLRASAAELMRSEPAQQSEPNTAGPDTAGPDGVVAIDSSGRRQVLAGVYRRAALARAVVHARVDGPIDGLSVRGLLEALYLTEVPVPDSSTRDIDTWADATAAGIDHIASRTPGVDPMSTPAGVPVAERDQAALVRRWVADLTLELLGGDPESPHPDLTQHIDAILALAGTAAHAVVRPAAPLTTFVAGYAAGLAAQSAADPVTQYVAAAEDFATRWVDSTQIPPEPQP